MDFLRNPLNIRFLPLTLSLLGAVALLIWLIASPDDGVALAFAVAAALSALGVYDLVQDRHAVLRNYPISAHLRYIFEEMRPEMRQYFFETEKDGKPFSRDDRSLIYQRAKLELDQRPFGTQLDVYDEGFEWLRHSMQPKATAKELFRVRIGGPDCALPYSASVLNISAMSFGALGANAIRALNLAAKTGGFAQDTGEGGISPHHRQFGGDLIWEIGSGYFSARTPDGRFSPELFAKNAADPQIRMVELKLSQGAKPGHGGVLPGVKVTAEIAAIRGVPQGVDCVSPARHSAFSTPLELMTFIGEMRRLAGGKPTGFKLCVGQPQEFLAVCKAMLETGVYPDFIVVDGKEGGTGAAPQEFMDHLGMPMREGLNFVHNALVGIGARERVRIGAAGKIVTAFDMARAMALGADWCNAARGFMFSIGCIQSLSCHNSKCPTGVATQDPGRGQALVVADKSPRAANFHRETLESLAELTAAAGLDHPSQFGLAHFSRRITAREMMSLADLYPALRPGELLEGARDPRFAEAWLVARPDRFQG
jgi:glutamate synthase domain-containing protein 2